MVFLLTSCMSAKTSNIVPPAQTSMLEITGELTYRERIALPPQSVAVVQLRDVSLADAPSAIIAEQRIDLAGRQVPVPFTLTVDRAKLTTGRRYSVRGSISGPGQQQLWTTTDAHMVDPSAQKVELGTLMMTRASAQGPAPGTAGGTQESTFTATGNEPGWRLDMSAQEITLLTNLGKTRVTGPRTAPQISVDTRRFVTTADGKQMIVTIVNRICNDSMSGMPRPQTVTVLYDGQELKGCGGNSADLLQVAEWVVTEMDGKPVAESMRGTLNFGKDGRVTGRSFCNNYGGNYTLTGEGLSIELKISTLMACLPEVGTQEKLFIELLDGVQRFEIDSSGTLILHSSNGRTLKARRA
jgi:uncharacterized lipoprotein YbaY/heat shock protein HslJ